MGGGKKLFAVQKLPQSSSLLSLEYTGEGELVNIANIETSNITNFFSFVKLKIKLAKLVLLQNFPTSIKHGQVFSFLNSNNLFSCKKSDLS